MHVWGRYLCERGVDPKSEKRAIMCRKKDTTMIIYDLAS